jgi:hypothetical protein
MKIMELLTGFSLQEDEDSTTISASPPQPLIHGTNIPDEGIGDNELMGTGDWMHRLPPPQNVRAPIAISPPNANLDKRIEGTSLMYDIPGLKTGIQQPI